MSNSTQTVRVHKAFLIRENEKAKQAKTTQHCRLNCAGCGVTKVTGHPCFDYKKESAG